MFCYADLGMKDPWNNTGSGQKCQGLGELKEPNRRATGATRGWKRSLTKTNPFSGCSGCTAVKFYGVRTPRARAVFNIRVKFQPSIYNAITLLGVSSGCAAYRECQTFIPLTPLSLLISRPISPSTKFINLTNSSAFPLVMRIAW